jgi:type IV secretory pathway VirB3-like protein
MDNEKISDYSWKVHRSLLRRDLVAGVSRITFAIIILLTVYMVFGVRQYWFVAVSIVIYLVVRALTKSDEYLVEIILDALLLPDDLYP